MEGGKKLKTKITLKIIFITLLVAISIGLVILIFTTNNEDNEINKIVDYKIVDDTTSCEEELEEIYKDNKSTYYLPCVKSANIKLVWDNGETDLLKNAINNGKVTIESLKEHGLEIYEYEN